MGNAFRAQGSSEKKTPPPPGRGSKSGSSSERTCKAAAVVLLEAAAQVQAWRAPSNAPDGHSGASRLSTRAKGQ